MTSRGILLNFAIETVLQAGVIVRSGVHQHLLIAHKQAANLVTDIDHCSEALIIAAPKEHFPSHTILGEEYGLQAADGRYTWLIDPLDGTTNYVHRFPFYAIALGLLVEDVIELCVVYDPVRDGLFTASRGAGTYCNGRPLHVSTVESLESALVSACFPNDARIRSDNNGKEFLHVQQHAQSVVRLGSAVLGFAYVGMGRLDAFGGLRLNAWDTSATLLVTEAGGQVSTWSGDPWNSWSVNIIASNAGDHRDLIGLLMISRGE